MGTALNEDQLRMLKKYTRRMVLALDADAAGEKATLRGLELARQALDRTEEMGFDAHGLLRREARLQADVRVTTLPEGADPDDVVLADPQKWRDILSAAQPIVVHVMETLAKEKDLDDPKTKSAIAAQVLPLIEDVPSPVERDAYRQRLARLLKVDERSLLGSQRVAQRGPRRTSHISPPTAEPVRPVQEKSAPVESLFAATRDHLPGEPGSSISITDAVFSVRFRQFGPRHDRRPGFRGLGTGYPGSR
jgi:DNA primase